MIDWFYVILKLLNLEFWIHCLVDLWFLTTEVVYYQVIVLQTNFDIFLLLLLPEKPL